MIFNSSTFLAFFIVFFILYYLLRHRIKSQNILLLVGSYIFYGWWDFRFLSLIIFSTLVDFWVGNKISAAITEKGKRKLLFMSLSINLGLLIVFKYFNFFMDSLYYSLNQLGYTVENQFILNVILPVGISFYTFQTLSYSIDIYRGKIKPAKSYVSFAAFVGYFPQLVAGPIERASNLLPQIENPRKITFQDISIGSRLALWGFFKKVVIADSLAIPVDDIFGTYSSLSGETLILGVFFFSFQIYCDFSGYSDIAIGLSRCMGIRLMSNFKFPYFSRNISEFWRRWHISLSSWFKDYLYIPLGGASNNTYLTLRNVLIVFLISGLWHGANITFILWGVSHFLFYLIEFLLKSNRTFLGDPLSPKFSLSYFKQLTLQVRTFVFVAFAWIFFRSENIESAFEFINIMLTTYSGSFEYIRFLFYPALLWFLDFLNRRDEIRIYQYLNLNLVYLIDFFLLYCVLGYFNNTSRFIYFTF